MAVDEPSRSSRFMKPKDHSHDDAPIDVTVLPDWTPEPVRNAILTIEQMRLTWDDRPILRRLAFDDRMKRVWSELLRRSAKSGKFFNQARPRDQSDHRTTDELQSAALEDILLFSLIAAFESRPVAKPEDIEATKETALRYEEALRAIAMDLESGIKAAQLGLTETFEIKRLVESDRAALLRVADWYAGYVRSLRKRNDPLMVVKKRGDPVQRGVLMTIANRLHEKFGQYPGQTAATLTSVALGVSVGARPARSALAKKLKRKRKASKSPKRI